MKTIEERAIEERAKEYVKKYYDGAAPQRYLAFIRGAQSERAELARLLDPKEIEDRMLAKAHAVFLEMMTGLFHGEMPQKLADEFIQKLNT